MGFTVDGDHVTPGQHCNGDTQHCGCAQTLHRFVG